MGGERGRDDENKYCVCVCVWWVSGREAPPPICCDPLEVRLLLLLLLVLMMALLVIMLVAYKAIHMVSWYVCGVCVRVQVCV